MKGANYSESHEFEYDNYRIKFFAEIIFKERAYFLEATDSKKYQVSDYVNNKIIVEPIKSYIIILLIKRNIFC